MGFFDSASSLIGPAAMGAGYVMGGSVGGALMAGGLGYMGTEMTNEANAARADAANQWSADQFGTRYQRTVQDLQAAGLNPMLAYSQGGGSPPTAQQVQFQNPVASASQVYQAVRGTEAQATRDFSSANQADAQVTYINQQVDNLKEEFKNIPLKGNEINAVVAKLAEEKTLLMRKGLNEIEIGNNLRQMGSKLKSETNLLDNQVEVERSLDNIGRYSKELGPIAQLLLNVIRSK